MCSSLLQKIVCSVSKSKSKKMMKKVGVQAHVVSHVLYVNPFQTKNILRSSPKCVRSLSSKASLRLKLLKRGATLPLTALAMWLMCGHRGECELDGDQIFQIPSNVVHYFIPPSKKNMMLRELLHRAFTLSPTHRAPMLLFLYIVITCWLTISMTTSISADVFIRYECVGLFSSLSSQLETLHSCLAAHFGGVTFCGNFTICALAKSLGDAAPDPRSAFISFTFIFLCSHMLTPGTTLTPSAIKCMSIK